MARPTTCIYCDGEGNSLAGKCGFCKNGKPLDTQEDWDGTWGRILPTSHEEKQEEKQDD